REYCISGDEYSSDVLAFSRTSGTPPGPLPRSLLRDSATSKTWWRLPQWCFFSNCGLQMCDPVLKA
ncbi:hypothetical protein, partial [Pseudomonas viridiflava]|uniref:hypothetical protein n=1 Tax=Pseudomonas viridiflava TaxID=33069 RepID=UPI001C11CEBD